MSHHMRRRIHACHMKRRRMPVQSDTISQKSAPQYLGVHFRISASQEFRVQGVYAETFWQELRIQGLGFSQDTTCDAETAWQSPASQSFSIMVDVKGLGFRVQLGHNLNHDRCQMLPRMRSIVCWCVFVRRAKRQKRPHRKVKEIQYTHKKR